MIDDQFNTIIKYRDFTVENILKFNRKLCVMHCTAAYPAKENMMNLNFIKTLKKKYPKITIGLSDHYSGILSSTVAFLNGAVVFEKHVFLWPVVTQVSILLAVCSV